jgi:hypothetical protein
MIPRRCRMMLCYTNPPEKILWRSAKQGQVCPVLPVPSVRMESRTLRGATGYDLCKPR